MFSDEIPIYLGKLTFGVYAIYIDVVASASIEYLCARISIECALDIGEYGICGDNFL